MFILGWPKSLLRFFHKMLRKQTFWPMQYIAISIYLSIYVLYRFRSSLSRCNLMSTPPWSCQLVFRLLNSNIILPRPFMWFHQLFQNWSIKIHSEKKQDPTEKKQYKEAGQRFGQTWNSFSGHCWQVILA